MTFWTWSKVVALLGGQPRLNDEPLQRICTDSRQCLPGDLFVALTGAHYDGHDFLEVAHQRGALAALIEHPASSGFAAEQCHQVPSTLKALATLAHYQRQVLAPHVVAVTGSNGKTTVKEMIAGVLRAHVARMGDGAVWATPGNFNNAIGVPLTLLALTHEHRWAVVEMGMNHAGEITALTQMAMPDVALITNIQRAHLGYLGTLEQIAHAKAEIFAGLSDDGVAVMPTDTAFLPLLRRAAGDHRCMTFGFETEAMVHGSLERGGLRIALSPDISGLVRLQVLGSHNHLNALAAAAASYAAGMPWESIRAGLESFSGVAGRLQARFSPLGALILDDTYNANPDSVSAALKVLAEREGRKILVMGDLGELGEHAGQLHAELGHEARALGIDECYTIGQWARFTSAAFGLTGRHESQAEALIARLRPQLNAHTSVLVKGSRFMKMEQIVKGLLG